ncbi:hypothetical protein LJB42_002166 [Komagataella kurtzmanii]|nr:hypothetical protein LJB42_002166 [Komagataella kurtzmanii]
MWRPLVLVLALLRVLSPAKGLELELSDLSSLQHATSLVADGLMDYYEGFHLGGTIGMFTNPYYWWQSGAAFGSILDYWWYMENDTFHDAIMQAIVYQAGDNADFMPLNQTTTEGNDDQGFWGITAMAAVERNFTNPPEDEPQWLYLVQATVNTMWERWDLEHCNGGLRWQIFQWNAGYNYKNTVSNACLFQLSARLARYTANDTYITLAEEAFDWMYGAGFLTEGDWWFVYDGAFVDDNCTEIVMLQWTYNAGLMVSGCAYLANYTGDEMWLDRTENFVHGIQVFTNQSVFFEAACQGSGNCNTDQRSFKAYLARFLGLTAQMVPSTAETIMNWMNTSAVAVAQSCSGGTDGHTCGMNWLADGWDGFYGLGEQMSALETLQNTRALVRPAPYTAQTGGSSQGDPAAGLGVKTEAVPPLKLTNADVAGAAIITAIIGLSVIAGVIWLLL